MIPSNRLLISGRVSFRLQAFFRSESAKTRSCAQWIEMKYFFTVESTHTLKNSVKSIYNTPSKKILNRFIWIFTVIYVAVKKLIFKCSKSFENAVYSSKGIFMSWRNYWSVQDLWTGKTPGCDLVVVVFYLATYLYGWAWDSFKYRIRPMGFYVKFLH